MEQILWQEKRVNEETSRYHRSVFEIAANYDLKYMARKKENNWWWREGEGFSGLKRRDNVGVLMGMVFKGFLIPVGERCLFTQLSSQIQEELSYLRNIMIKMSYQH